MRVRFWGIFNVLGVPTFLIAVPCIIIIHDLELVQLKLWPIYLIFFFFSITLANIFMILFYFLNKKCKISLNYKTFAFSELI